MLEPWLEHDDVTLYHGDCLEIMAQLPDASVDMVLCDLPYGTTQNSWDTIIDLDKMWAQYNRIAKPNAAFVLTAQQPFTSVLGASNLKYLKYDLVWNKTNTTGFLNAKKMPMKSHEDILVFYRNLPSYNPQMKPEILRKQKPAKMTAEKHSANYGTHSKVVPKKQGTMYPGSILRFASERGLHPTQKPVALFKYLIETYTNRGDLVLDNCIGSGTTAVAARRTGRRCIGIDTNESYLSVVRQRLR